MRTLSSLKTIMDSESHGRILWEQRWQRCSTFVTGISWRTHWNLLVWWYSLEGLRHHWETFQNNWKSREIPAKEREALLANMRQDLVYRCDIGTLLQQPLPTQQLPEEKLVVNQYFVLQKRGRIRTDNFIIKKIKYNDLHKCYIDSDNDHLLPVVFVMDPVTEIIYPYSVPESLLPLFRILNKGVIPPSLSPELLHLLRSINVLVPDDYAIWCKQRKKQLIAEGRECLKRDGFFVIKQLMPEYQRKTLAAYLTTKLNWDRKHHIWKWNEPVCHILNSFLTPFATALVEESSPLVNSGPILHFYAPGSNLCVHFDTGEYTHSMSLCLETDGPDSTNPAPPLCFITTDLAVYKEARLAPGDALFFTGSRTPHYRNRLEEGRSVISLSFSWDIRRFFL